MRSRYAAYALGLADYILGTTHPKNPIKQSRASIEAFSQGTSFDGLEIREHTTSGDQAMVTFLATLSHKGRDASFTETSRFERLLGRWLYLANSP